jgi:hypoxanthine-guanine phosphoribosyltransferase
MAEQIDEDFQQILKNDPNARFLVIGILNGAFMITSEIVRRLKTPV